MSAIDDALKEVMGGGSSKKKNKGPQSNIELAQLQIQNQQLDAEKQLFGVPKKKGGPSVVSRVFDVLSRPNYAMAEGERKSQETQRKGKGGLFGIGALPSFVGGAIQGLEGHKKTGFADVLNEAANAKENKAKGVLHVAAPKNKVVQAIAGLGLDIVTDPTTYLTGGVTKAISGTDKAAQVAKASGQALKTAENINAVKTAEKAAKFAALADAGKAGLKAPGKKELKVIGKDAANEVRQNIIKAAQEKAKTGIEAASPGTVNLKFGKLGELQSKTAYKATKGVKDFAVGLPGVKQGLEVTNPLRTELLQKFSTGAVYGPINEERKLLRARSVANYDDIVDRYGLNKLNLTQQEAKDFSHAYEKGTSAYLGTSKHGVDYADLTSRVKKLNNEMFHEEKLAGLIPEDAKEADNYLYHIYNQGTEGQKRAFKALRQKAIASDAFNPAVEKNIPTLESAIEKGLNPEQNIISIMKERAAKHTQSLARRDLVNEAAKKYGVQLSKDEAKNFGDMVDLKKTLKNVAKGAHMGYLDDGTFVHKDIAGVLGNIERMYRTPESLKHVVGLMDKAQNMWKTGVTVYSPSHHTRNLMSDVFLNALDGVVEPTRYSKALELISGKGLQGTTKIGKDRLNNELLMKLFHESGASPSFIQTEELSKGITHKLTAGLHNFAEKRESFGRLAHFIDSLDKEAAGVSHGGYLSKDLLDASKRASARVRKWNIDYGDLTDFEKNVMKRVAPFYTWLRKSTPLMVEAAATRPGRVAVIPKGLNALSKLTGMDPNDKLPVDMIPKWIREMGAIEGYTSHAGNPVFVSPNLPPMDTAKLFEGGRKGIISNLLSQTSPLIKAPIELGTGRSLYSGAPNGNVKDYLLQQLPYTRIGQSLAQNAGDPAKNDNATKLLNFLTGAGLYEATPNRLAGEQRRQMDPKNVAIRKAKKKYINSK